jgi:hypothetical protein
MTNGVRTEALQDSERFRCLTDDVHCLAGGNDLELHCEG